MERQHLIDLCEAGIVAHDKWADRDSAETQQGLGKAWALLRAGCPYKVRTKENHPKSSCVTDERTIWIEIEFKGFMWHEGTDDETDPLQLARFYIPTQARLDEANGEDWY